MSRLLLGLLSFLGADGMTAEYVAPTSWAIELLHRIEQHPQLLSGREQVYRAGQDAVAAEQPLYNPEIELNWSKKEKFDPEDNYEGAIRQTIDWASKREARARVAELRSDAQEAVQRQLRQKLLAAALDAAIEAHCADQLQQNTVFQQKRLVKLAEMIEHRRRLGEATRIDVDFGYLALAGQLDIITETEIRRNKAMLAFKNALPGVESPLGLPTDALKVPDSGSIDDWLDTLPILKVAQKNLHAARVEIEAASRNKVADPTLGLVGGKDDDDKYIGLSVSIPLNVRNTYEAQVLSAGYEAAALEQNYRNLVRVARNRMRAARDNYQRLYSRWQDWKILTGQRLLGDVALLERMWRSGELTTRDFVTELKQRNQTRAAGFEIEASLWHSWVEWLYASGQVESWLRNLATP